MFMDENQTQPEINQKSSTTKWALLTVGGCLVLLAFLALALVLVVRLFDFQTNSLFTKFIIQPSSTPFPTPIPTRQALPGSHPEIKSNSMGNSDAKVKIIEYADFQCPYCLRYWQETEPQIIKTYVATGKAYYEYRSMGAFIGPDSASAAEAAYCAGDQGKFWQYHDILFSNWTGENTGDFAPDKLRKYAPDVDLDQKIFDTCLTQRKHTNQVQQDVANAKADGIRATPSFLINGTLIEGAQPFNIFQQTIENALKGS
jgi:predicted DsbA family dithiol-disulfide isomerase